MSTAPIFTEAAFAMPTYAHCTVILNRGLALAQHDPGHRLGRAFGPQTTYPMVGEPPDSVENQGRGRPGGRPRPRVTTRDGS